MTVVGFDGSDMARAAVACASRRLGHGDRLVAAHVVGVPPALLESPYFESALARARERGARVLEEAKGALARDAPAELRLVEGPPAHALVGLAREVGAAEIAVGSRGFGALRAAGLGGTSHALLHETDRPVLVVPRRAAGRELRLATGAEQGGTPAVVVGYDGSEGAAAALEYATRRAEALGGSLTAVCAFYAPHDWYGAPYYQLSLDEQEERARELVRGLEERPDVETDVIMGPPVESLVRVAQARDAAEIVVGARGLGRFRAALGSVSHELLHEADRPVVIVPRAPGGSP